MYVHRLCFDRVSLLAGGETLIRAWNRYLKLEYDPEAFIAACLRTDPPCLLEAAKYLSLIVYHPTTFVSKHEKSIYDHWQALVDIITDQGEDLEIQIASLKSSSRVIETVCPSTLLPIKAFDIEEILRHGIKAFPEQAGFLWSALAKHFILKGDFEKVRAIFNEAMETVMTVKDFSIVFDAYAKFEESILSLYLGSHQEDGDDEQMDDADIDEHLARLEKLLDKRPFMVNSVHLKQNPHSVPDWLERVKLYKEKDDIDNVIATYEEAISTVTAKKVSGRHAELFVQYATFREERDELDLVREVFEKGTQVSYKNIEDLSEIWCSYAEFEIRHSEFEKARTVLSRATAPPKGVNASQVSYTDAHIVPQKRIFKSLKIWSFYVDLEESIGTTETTKQIYDRILELKIANPQVLFNYADFLWGRNYFQDCFKVYERGIELFGFPAAMDMWVLYLQRFMERSESRERTRELFEQSLDGCPQKFCKQLYLLFAKFEEERGSVQRMCTVYTKAVDQVELKERKEVYELYISKVREFFGLPATRPVFEKALQDCPDNDARELALRFIEVEISLGEVDRARAIYGYACQFSEPKTQAVFWEKWKEFEVQYGNEDTFKEMLRLKRSVSAKYGQDILTKAKVLLENKQPETLPNAMEQLEQEQAREEEEIATPDAGAVNNTRVVGFVRATVTEKKPTINAGESGPSVPVVANPDEIEIGDDSDEDDEKSVPEPSVPSAVFGSLKDAVKPVDKEEEAIGAKERFKRKRNV